MLVLRKPYLLYLGDAVLKSDCKTAFGLRDWCGQDVIGEWSHPAAKVTLGLPRLSPAEAARQGAGSIVVGVAPTGGLLPEHWQDDLEAALAAGLDAVSGLHTRLASLPRLVRAAAQAGTRLVDVRNPPDAIPGRQRTQAHRPARADRRHRLRARQEVHGAGADARAAVTAARPRRFARRARPAS